MTRNEIIELLKGGFNVGMLADAFFCSVGRINELKCEPVEGQVYHKADINAEALVAFAEKHEIDITTIDFEAICAAKKQKAEKVEYQVGDVTKYGKIINISKVGQSYAYVLKNDDGEIIIKSTKEMKA